MGCQTNRQRRRGDLKTCLPPEFKNIFYTFCFATNTPFRNFFLFCTLPKEKKSACLLSASSNIKSFIPNLLLYIHPVPFFASYSIATYILRGVFLINP